MHDPMVVAFEIKRPWPARSSFGDRKRWWPSMVTVWHVEPKGHDSGTVCKHYLRWQDEEEKWHSKPLRAWRWHVWHWRLQVVPVQQFHRWVFERCELCGRRYPWNYSPVAHSWNLKRGRWFHFDRRAYHHECSELVHARSHLEEDRAIVRDLFGAYRVLADVDELTAGERLLSTSGVAGEEWNARWRRGQRMKYLLGWKHNHDTSRLEPALLLYEEGKET